MWKVLKMIQGCQNNDTICGIDDANQYQSDTMSVQVILL